MRAAQPRTPLPRDEFTDHRHAWNTGGDVGHYLSRVPENAKILLEQAVVAQVKGWQLYAEAHLLRYGSPIGEDPLFGPEWKGIGVALLALLNGETGRLRCGTVDAVIRQTFKDHFPGAIEE